MAKFDDFVDAVIAGSKELAAGTLGGFKDQAGADAKAFLEKSKADLERWVKLRAERNLTDQDFEDLVQAKKAVAEMHALTTAGIAAAKLERFRTDLIKLVVDKAKLLL